MRNIAIICVGLLGICHAYSETKTGNGYASASSGTGAYGGGSYGSGGGYGSGGVAFPIPPFLGSAGIGNQLAHGMSMTSTTGAATAQASSALHPDELFQQQFQQQQSILGQIQNQATSSGAYGGGGGSYGSGYGGGYGGSAPGSYGGGYGGSFSGSGSGYPNHASSSASYSPGGVHQTASISPANPAIPNVNTRFDTASSGGPGFVGVSSSSFSESSDVDGYQTNRRGAVTSVNDNGKVSTYYTHS